MVALQRPYRDGSPEELPAWRPASQAQQRFWFEEQLHPGNPALNVAVRWRIEGELADEHFTRAWRLIVARHETLRTSFAEVGGEPVAVVAPAVDFHPATHDLRHLDEHAAALEAERLADLEAHTPFDLARPPLIRVVRLALREDLSTLLVTAHHTVCDGWSIGILAREFGTVCAALAAGVRPALAQLPISYGDYAAEQRRLVAVAPRDESTGYARRMLEGYKQFELLPDRPRPQVQTSNGSIASLLLDRELTDGLGAFCASYGCTLFMTAYAALLVLLYRYSGETDIALGTQVVGRDDVEVENLVGCFINTLALRCDLSGDPTFADLLERARDTVLDTFEARALPLERLIEIVNPKRDLSRNALFSTNFIFQRSFIENARYGRFSLVDLPSRSAGALYDLNFFMVERPEGWRASCEYNTDLFEHTTVVRMLECLQNVLRAVVRDPHQRIAVLPILGDDELRRICIDANRTEEQYPADRTVTELIAAQAARTPHATALVCGERTMTYGELEIAAGRVAGELQRRGLAPGGRIGILIERSIDMVVALLGVLKSGCAYVPLDPAHPAQRLAFVAGNAGLRALIVSEHLQERAPLDAGVTMLDVEQLYAADDLGAYERPACADDVAYVIYTSGSTGDPKGVQIAHRAFVNLLWAMRERPGIAAGDTLAAVTTISFDIAGLELFGPLIAGAKVVIAQERDVSDGARLAALLRKSGATILQATPATWQLLVESGWSGQPGLKMLCGGEALPRALADALLGRGAELWNMYGPTETTVWSSVHRLDRREGSVPIGPPIANTQFYVLDRNLQIVPPGVPGELYIGGDGVALGYLGLPELTRERFIPDPFGHSREARLYRTGDVVRSRPYGLFEFLGRSDQQVKLRGFRIELGEIESMLLRDASVAEAAVIPCGSSTEQRLLAFVAPRDAARLEAPERWTAEVRARLIQALPAYMVPGEFNAVHSLPRTPNGKIDRRSLPALQGAAATLARSEPPRTSTERGLERMIAELLATERVGRTDDIFGLGFHSLLAVRLVNSIQQSYGVRLPLRTLFDCPTIAELAEQLDPAPHAAPALREASAIVELNSAGSRTPLIFLHSDLFASGLYCRRIAAALGPDQPLTAVAPHGTEDLPLLSTIEAMARDYVPRIRARQPAGPYRLGGFCVSGLIAYEIARLLRAQGEVVEDVFLVNASALPGRAVWGFDSLVRKVGSNARLAPRLRESLCYNVARLHAALALGPRTTLAFIAERMRALPGWRSRSRRRAFDGPAPMGAAHTPRDIENSFAHLVAALTYHPQPYDAAVTLVCGTEEERMTDDLTLGWGKLTAGVRVVPIGGGHLAALNDRVEELARALAPAAEAASHA